MIVIRVVGATTDRIRRTTEAIVANFLKLVESLPSASFIAEKNVRS